MEIFGWILEAEFAVFLEQDQRDESQSAFILMVTEDNSNESTLAGLGIEEEIIKNHDKCCLFSCN